LNSFPPFFSAQSIDQLCREIERGRTMADFWQALHRQTIIS
jgi:hypothetical protein